MSKKTMKVLDKIASWGLYHTWTHLSNEEIEIIVQAYGESWYEFFFTSHHIIDTKELILKDKNKSNEIIAIYGAEWYATHIKNFKKKLQIVTLSYEYMAKQEKDRKMAKLLSKQKAEQDAVLNYSVVEKWEHDESVTDQDEMGRIIDVYHSTEQENWCHPSDSESDSDSDDEALLKVDLDPEDYPKYLDRLKLEEHAKEEIEHLIERMVGGDEENFDFAEIEEVNNFDTQVENELQDLDTVFSELDEIKLAPVITPREIKDAISKEAYDKTANQIIEFDTSKDNSMFDMNLKDLIVKKYVTHQYIFKDDTIKTINHKICCAIKNNPKFGDNAYIIPSYQYLWSSYYYKGHEAKVMIGQKWVLRNDVLRIDIEPINNLNVYTDLRDKIKSLRDNIKRQGKMRREDDENNILYDYRGYFTYNELYMVDIYNELGINYRINYEEFKNLVDVYFKIYFPKIGIEDARNIVDVLQTKVEEKKKSVEMAKLKTIYEALDKELVMENEIMRDVETIRKKKVKDYSKILKEKSVTQSAVRGYLLEDKTTLDLYRIYDNFELGPDFPFIRYQPINGTSKCRFVVQQIVENTRKEIVAKWFENSPYGISFKIRISGYSAYKYMAINLSDTGRIDYNIQMKEDDNFTVQDIKKTYKYIQDLVKKINNENAVWGLKLKVPNDQDFNYVFISAIQKIQIPNNHVINHNDFSEFSRYFYPYVALVIDPKKRESRQQQAQENKSKFGTYLRYKRISKYDIKTKIEHRIIFFIRNYEYDDQSLAQEIAKEFNITEMQGYEELKNVRLKYPNIKKSRRILKKLENVPKYKPPGIEIAVQGKGRNKYKMKISGARDEEQLERIASFVSILFYLYIETYLFKNPKMQRMKDKLKKLTRIAKRAKKVEEFVDSEEVEKSIKKMVSVDKERLSSGIYGESNKWSRDCQNSGDDKRRRPQHYLNEEDLKKNGYEWQETIQEDGTEFGHYAKQVEYKDPVSGKKKRVTLRALRLPLNTAEGNKFVYYTCDPEINGKHMYAGFLSKSKGDVPCCFIKDQLFSKKREKRLSYMRHSGMADTEMEQPTVSQSEKLYILQDSGRVQDGRFAYLPKYLDILFNYMLGKNKNIKNHYLTNSETGYYFKYGVRQDETKYMSALSSVLEMSIDELKTQLINSLKKDKNLRIYTSLNNGDVRTQFGDISNYIGYIANNEQPDHQYLGDLLSTPGVITKKGINIIIFQKKISIIRKSFEREKHRESYILLCQNHENVLEMLDPERKTIILMKENKYYYPIVFVEKYEEQKDLHITKNFHYEDKKGNIVHHLYDYYKLNCGSETRALIFDVQSDNLTARETYAILMDAKNDDLVPIAQVVDTRNKARFLITRVGDIIPVLPSGSLYNIKVDYDVTSYVRDFAASVDSAKNIYESLDGKIRTLPVGVYFSKKTEKFYTINGLITLGQDAIPIIPKNISAETVAKVGLKIENRPDEDLIDRELAKEKKGIYVDDRIYYVSRHKYNIELYQLFRYHLSYYLNNTMLGLNIRHNIITTIENQEASKATKRNQIKKIMYEIIDSKLAATFNELLANIKQKGGKTHDPLSDAKKPVGVISTKDNVEVVISDDATQVESGNDADVDADFNFHKNEIPREPKATSKLIKNEKKWISIYPETQEIDYPQKVLHNMRNLCYYNKTQKNCSKMDHCTWNEKDSSCMLAVRKDDVIGFVNKVSEEFVRNDYEASEVLRREGYFVSDIVDYNVFTEREGERIIVPTNIKVEKILSEIFDKGIVPRIGKRKNYVDKTQSYLIINNENPIKEYGNWYIQNVIYNNNSIYRAFANCYFWLLHPYNEKATRNIGYYSSVQTELANQYKSQVSDWLLDIRDQAYFKKVKQMLKKKDLEAFVLSVRDSVNVTSECLVELYALSVIYATAIVIFNHNMKISHVLTPERGLIYNRDNNSEDYDLDKLKSDKIIYVRLSFNSNAQIPNKIDAVYPKI